MYTIVKGAAVLNESYETGVEWIPFHDLVRESGTRRSFARIPSERAAADVAARLSALSAEVLVDRSSGKFEIVLYRPASPPGRPVRA